MDSIICQVNLGTGQSMANKKNILLVLIVVAIICFGIYYLRFIKGAISLTNISQDYQNIYSLGENRYLGDKDSNKLDFIEIQGLEMSVKREVEYTDYLIIKNQIVIFDQSGIDTYSSLDFSQLNNGEQYIVGNIDGNNIYLELDPDESEDQALDLVYKANNNVIREESASSIYQPTIFTNIGDNQYELIFDQATATLVVYTIGEDYQMTGEVKQYNNVADWYIEQDYLVLTQPDQADTRFFDKQLNEIESPPLFGLCIDYRLDKNYLHIDHQVRVDLPANINDQSKVYCQEDTVYIWLDKKLYGVGRDVE